LTEKLVIDLITKIEPQLFYLLIKLMLAGLAILLLKGVLENLVAWIQFSLNKRLGIGVRVMVRGKIGKISWFNSKWIFVETDDGEIIIPTKRWMLEKWTVLNNNKEVK